MERNCTKAFIIVAVMTGFMGYLAVVDANVRAAFAQLAGSGITGYFSLVITAHKKEDDASPK
jgi:hypothetical protein